MGFTWVNFYPSFIKEILEASNLDKGQIEQMDYAIKNDDNDSLITGSILRHITTVFVKFGSSVWNLNRQ